MTAGIISLCGAWGGQLAGGTKYNQRGMFENTEIRNQIVKPFLIKIGCDPMGQKPLPEPDKNSDLKKDLVANSNWLRKEVLKIIRGQGYHNDSTWFYKGAKICLIWQMWHLAFPKAKWILVRRRDSDIIRSCMKTSFMKKCGNEKGWQEWINVHKKRFAEMRMMGLNMFEIWPQDIINGDFHKIRAALESFGLVWKKEKVVEFVSPALWTAGSFERVIEKELNDVNLSCN